MAISAATLGIIAFILSWIPILGMFIGWIMGVLAIIFGGIGLSRATSLQVGKGLAVVGLVFGIVTVILKMMPVVGVL
jgi:hypothetical protein